MVSTHLYSLLFPHRAEDGSEDSNGGSPALDDSWDGQPLPAYASSDEAVTVDGLKMKLSGKVGTVTYFVEIQESSSRPSQVVTTSGSVLSFLLTYPTTGGSSRSFFKYTVVQIPPWNVNL